jgi:hypothetical protein
MVREEVRDMIELWRSPGSMFSGETVADEIMGDDPNPGDKYSQWRIQYDLIEREGNSYLNSNVFGEECFFPNLKNEKDPKQREYPPDPDLLAAFEIIEELRVNGVTDKEMLEVTMRYLHYTNPLMRAKDLRDRFVLASFDEE